MANAGLIVITEFMSPFISGRHYARQIVADDEFFEVFFDAPFEVYIAREPKGLCKKRALNNLKTGQE